MTTGKGPRFLTPGELNEPQAELKSWAEKLAPEGVQYERDGALQGPFAPFFYTSDMIKWYFSGAFLSLQQPPFKEHPQNLKIVVHAVLSTYDPPHPFIKYAHGQSSIDLEFTQAHLDAMIAGQTSADLGEDEKVLYEFAVELAKSRGPIGDALFWRADEVLGKERLAANIHMVIGYIQASLLCYVADSSPALPSMRDVV